MDILEAKAFFKEYNGLEFHMCHDDTRKYQEYRSLHITEISKNRWRREIIKEIFAQLEKERSDRIRGFDWKSDRSSAEDQRSDRR